MTAILGIATAVPATAVSQRAVRDLFAAQPGISRLTARLIRAAFDRSAIDIRHTVLTDFDGVPSGFINSETSAFERPTTAQRNAIYVEQAPKLFAQAARGALQAAGVVASEITHVVTASCTGFFAPGPDFRLVRDLGIPSSAQRDHVGFLGCAAAFPALRAAYRICAADPGAVVLVACGELCSIHLAPSSDTDQILASAVFADGAGAAIVSAARAARGPSLVMDGFATRLTSEGADDMQWIIGDHGFEMTLTQEVPRIIEREVAGLLAPVLARGEIDRWAVHPGGRSILDRFEHAMGLAPNALDHSREVLRAYGNMSSATVLFVLQRLLADATLTDGERILGIAFGPGLTVEIAELRARLSTAPQPSRAAPALALARAPR